MKILTTILNALLLVVLLSCSGGSTDGKTGIYEPETEEQFISILDYMGIKPYPGAEVTQFTRLADAILIYKIKSSEATNKQLIDYYKKAFAEAFKDREDWKLFLDTPLSVEYVKGFDMKMSFTIKSKNAARELAGDMEDVPKYLKFEISLGDGAD